VGIQEHLNLLAKLGVAATCLIEVSFPLIPRVVVQYVEENFAEPIIIRQQSQRLLCFAASRMCEKWTRCI
jgi:hypothetical protein